MPSSTASDNGVAVLSTSAIKLTVEQPFSLSKADPNLLYITIQLPSSSFTASASGCTVASGTCSYLSSINGYNVTFVAINAFPLLVQFSATTQYFLTKSSSFTIQMLYNGSLISSNTNTTVSVYCTTPCRQCTLSPTNCSTCMPSIYTSNTTLYYQNNSCLAVCPDGFYT
jgi:hypothetical protein